MILSDGRQSRKTEMSFLGPMDLSPPDSSTLEVIPTEVNALEVDQTHLNIVAIWGLCLSAYGLKVSHIC